jgi:putative copper resistance protein D
VAFVAVLVALQVGGGSAPEKVLDPGAIVRWGLPLAKLIVDLGAAGTLGALVLAAVALTHGTDAYGRALDVAAASAMVWAVSSAASTVFTCASIYPQPVTFDASFSSTLASYVTEHPVGQAWLATTLIAAALAVLCFAVRNQTVVGLLVVATVIGFIPVALQGHASDTASHSLATSAIWLHVLGAAVWVGGLATMSIVGGLLNQQKLLDVMRRYSTLALACFVVVAASGYVSAEIRVGSWAALLTPYGILVLVKVFAIGALGVAGLLQRRWFLGRMARPDAGRRWFWALVTTELAFMGLASGVAAALARTATPVSEVPATALESSTPAEILTGAPLPPPVTLGSMLTLVNPDLIWLLVVGFGLFLYLAGVVRLHRRGDRWPIHRTVLFVLGMIALLYVTNGGPNAYEQYLFSVHMAAHMLLTMVVPLFIALSGPVTLGLRAIVKRTDGSRGGREWILTIVHNRIFGVLSHPVVAAVLFAGSLWVFYYSPLFRWATLDHVGHEWMTIHFLITGYLFVNALAGVDPAPYRASYPMRLLVLLGTMAFHAFFGLALLSGTGLLLADWYGAMGWGAPAINDQQTGGGIAWGVGEIPTVVLAITVAWLWSRSDERESKRYDRKADRDGDAELEAYNEMLARRATRSG